jgi:hypothetical protein
MTPDVIAQGILLAFGTLCTQAIIYGGFLGLIWYGLKYWYGRADRLAKRRREAIVYAPRR